MAGVDHGLGVEALRDDPSAVFMIRDSGSVKFRSGSSPPKPSSPWPYSASAAIDQPSQAGNDPRISQESRKDWRFLGGHLLRWPTGMQAAVCLRAGLKGNYVVDALQVHILSRVKSNRFSGRTPPAGRPSGRRPLQGSCRW
jgi:hypothetical protein